MQKACPRIEVIKGIAPLCSHVKRIVKAVPNLKTIGFGRSIEVDQEVLEPLSACKYLNRIEFEVLEQGQDLPPHIKKVVTKAQDILKASRATDKVVRIWNWKTGWKTVDSEVVDS